MFTEQEIATLETIPANSEVKWWNDEQLMKSPLHSANYHEAYERLFGRTCVICEAFETPDEIQDFLKDSGFYESSLYKEWVNGNC